MGISAKRKGGAGEAAGQLRIKSSHDRSSRSILMGIDARDEAGEAA